MSSAIKESKAARRDGAVVDGDNTVIDRDACTNTATLASRLGRRSYPGALEQFCYHFSLFRREQASRNRVYGSGNKLRGRDSPRSTESQRAPLVRLVGV
jgi:hypothetical protein